MTREILTTISDTFASRVKPDFISIQKHNVSINQNGEYQLDTQLITTSKDCTYYHDDEKIAEVTNQNGITYLKFFTNKTCDIIGSPKVKAFYVRTRGKVNFQNSLQLKHFNLAAKSVQFHQPIRCSGGFHVRVNEQAIFSSRLNMNYMHITADDVLFEENVRAIADVAIVAKNTIQCRGEFNSKEILNLSAPDINFSKKINAKELEVNAEKVFRCTSGNIANNFKVKVKKFKLNEKALLEVGRRFIFNGDECALMGSTHFEKGCVINATERLYTSKKAYWKGTHHITAKIWDCSENAELELLHDNASEKSKIQISKEFYLPKGAKFKTHSNNSSIAFSCHNKTELNGEANLNHTRFNTRVLAVNDSSSLSMERSALTTYITLLTGSNLKLQRTRCVSDIFNVEKDASFNFENSTLILKKCLIDGHVIAKESVVEFERIGHTKSSTVHYQAVYFMQKTAKLSDQFSTTGSSTLKDVIIIASTSLAGKLLVEDLEVSGKEVSVSPETFSGNGININAETRLILHATHTHVEFKMLKATTPIFTTKGEITLTESRVLTNGKKVQENFGILHLNNSAVVTDGQIFNREKAKITAKQSSHGRSGIIAKTVQNVGEMDIDDGAVLKSDILIHVGKRVSATSKSVIIVKKDLMLDKEAQLDLKAEGVLDADQANILLAQGKLQAEDRSRFSAKDITTLAGSKMILDKSVGHIKSNLLQFGNSEITRSFLEIKRADILGTKTLVQAHLKAGEADITGEIKADKAELEVETKILTRPDAKVRLQDSKLTAEEMYHQGYLSSKKEKKPAPKKKVEGKELQSDEKKEEKTNPTLKLTKKLVTRFGSQIEGDDLEIEVGSWDHYGWMEVDNLFSKGKSLWNEGAIIAKHNMSISSNTYASLGGKLSANYAKLKTAAIANVLGEIHAHTLESSSFVNLNFGLVSAWNQQETSIFSLNYGLKLPSLNPTQIFSMEGMQRLGKQALQAAAGSVCPQLSSSINFAFAVPNMCTTMKSAWETGKKIKKDGFKKTWQNLQKAEWYELAEHATNVANFAVATYQFHKQAYHAATELVGHATKYQEHLKSKLKDENDSYWRVGIEDLQQNAKKAWESTCELPDFLWDKATHIPSLVCDTVNPFSWNQKKADAALGALKLAAAVLGPKYTAQNLIDLNGGAVVSHNINEMSLYGNNRGAKLASDSIVSSSVFFDNSGNMQAGYGSATLSGYWFNNDGAVVAGKGVNATFNKIKLTKNSQREYANWQLAAGELTVESSHEFKASQIKADKLNLNKFAAEDEVKFSEGSELLVDIMDMSLDVAMYGSSLVCKTLNQEANFKASDKTSVKVDGTHTTGKTTEFLLTKQSTAEVKLFDHHGKATVSEDSKHTAEKRIIHEDAKLQVIKQSSAVAGECELRGQLLIQDQSDSTVKNHQAVKKGGQIEVNNDSSATSRTQTLENGSSVTVSDHSSHRVEKEWIIENGAQAVAKNNIKHTDESTAITGGFSAGSLRSDGGLRLYESYTMVDGSLEFTEQADNFLRNGGLRANSIIDNGKLNYAGQSRVESTDYMHAGHIHTERDGTSRNSLHVKAKKGQLNGIADVDYGIYEIDQLVGDHNAFALGQGNYSNYRFKQGLDFITQAELNLSGENQRFHDLYFQGSRVNCDVSFQGDFNVALKSTVGDIHIRRNINARNIFADAAQSLYNHAYTDASENVMMQARGINGGGFLHNLGGRVTGQDVILTALAIKNITRDSNYARQIGQHLVNDQGIIFARRQALLEATQENIENLGGVIQGGDYAQLIAAQNVANECNETSYQAKYGEMRQYKAALIAGGAGTTSSNGTTGLLIKAGSRVINDGSTLESIGDDQIEGAAGVEFRARSYTYISKQYSHRSWLGFSKKQVTETDTQVQGSQLISRNGRNSVKSSEGEVQAVNTQFISAKGTNLEARKDIRTLGLETEHRRYQKTSSLWGLNNDKQRHYDQGVSPSIILDNGISRLHSHEGSVESRNTLFLGSGDLEVEAAHNILISRDILNHSLYQRTQSVAVSFFGMNALNTIRQGGNIWQALASEDVTLAKMNALWNSDNAAAFVANTWNLGINAFNTTSQLLQGMNEGALGSALLQRYGLGNSSGLNPNVTFSLTRSKTQAHYQSLAAGGINRGNVKLHAGNRIILENGVEVQAQKDADLRAKKIEASGAALHSKRKHTSKTASIGATVKGEGVNASVAKSKSKQHSVSHVNAKVHAGNNLNLDADKMRLDAAHATGKTISGHVKDLEVESRQDSNESSSVNVNANSSGAVFVSMQRQRSAKVKEASGIHGQDGINHDKKTFKVDRLKLKGGKVTSDGVINDFAENIHAESIEDFEDGVGFGVGLNLNDLRRVSNDAKPQPKNYVQAAIATAAVSFSHTHFQASQRATVFGAKGTSIDTNRVQGDLNTQNANGYQVHHDQRVNMQVDVPLTNGNYLKNAKNNIAEAFAKFKPSESSSVANASLAQPASSNSREDNSDPSIPEDLPPFVSPDENDCESDNTASPFTERDSAEAASDEACPDEVINASEQNKSSKIKSANIKLKTHDVRVSAKQGRHGMQKCNLDNSRYISTKGIFEELARKVSNAKMLQWNAKLASQKFEFLKPIREVIFELPIEFQYASDSGQHVIHPSILHEQYGYGSLEYDLSKGLFNAKIEVGKSVRANLASGAMDFGLIKGNYTVDLASLSNLTQIIFSTERGFKAEVRSEFRAMGPSFNGTGKSPEFCFLGQSIQFDASILAGIGIGRSVGAGVTFDKTTLKSRGYLLMGGFIGAGCQATFAATHGVDEQYHQQLRNEFNKVVDYPKNKMRSDNLDQTIAAIQADSPSGFWGSLWQSYCVNNLRGSQQELYENMFNEAQNNVNYGFKVR